MQFVCLNAVVTHYGSKVLRTRRYLHKSGTGELRIDIPFDIFAPPWLIRFGKYNLASDRLHPRFAHCACDRIGVVEHQKTRRTFFQVAAAIGTSQFPIRGANDRVNLTVIGIGGRGRDHVNEFATLSDCQVAGVCDVNQAARERAVAQVQKLKNFEPKTYADLREVYNDKDIDAVSIATPNHWHALATIWACQAGKDVYVEKPASHNIFEGGQMVAAARKYSRMVQVGSQGRSIQHKQHAMKLLHEGAIGQVYMARGLCYRLRKSIG